MTKRILTGIKATGTPHIGNYFGMFEPAIRRAAEFDESFFFIANYHSLNQIQNAEELERLTLTITASWLACGLNPETSHIYAQSDIPEIFELDTMLNSFTPKGWMNKAHAYKAASDKNQEANLPQDDGINMGLYTYPILMSADILMFHANVIPVGKDQIQHVEIARDIAQKINHNYDQELFTLPTHHIEEEVGTIPGIDGRKMSKSYDNVLPVFASIEDRQKAINKIVTDSSAPEDSKTVVGTALYEIYKLIASTEQLAQLTASLEQGNMGWGDAKKQIAADMDSYFTEMTAEYDRLMANPDEIRQILKDGAAKVRPIAQNTMQNLRTSTGIL